jgi:hypothetical protein
VGGSARHSADDDARRSSGQPRHSVRGHSEGFRPRDTRHSGLGAGHHDGGPRCGFTRDVSGPAADVDDESDARVARTARRQCGRFDGAGDPESAGLSRRTRPLLDPGRAAGCPGYPRWPRGDLHLGWDAAGSGCSWRSRGRLDDGCPAGWSRYSGWSGGHPGLGWHAPGSGCARRPRCGVDHRCPAGWSRYSGCPGGHSGLGWHAAGTRYSGCAPCRFVGGRPASRPRWPSATGHRFLGRPPAARSRCSGDPDRRSHRHRAASRWRPGCRRCRRRWPRRCGCPDRGCRRAGCRRSGRRRG